MTWQHKIDDALAARRSADTLRRRYVVAQGAGRWLETNDQRYLNFSSNDYLGLSHHPHILRAWQQGRSGLASVAAARATSAVIPLLISNWKRNWPTGWAIRARYCLFPVSPQIRR